MPFEGNVMRRTIIGSRLILGLLVAIALQPLPATASLLGDDIEVGCLYIGSTGTVNLCPHTQTTVVAGTSDVVFPYLNWPLNPEAFSILMTASPNNFICERGPPDGCLFNGLFIGDLNFGLDGDLVDVTLQTNFPGLTQSRVAFGSDFVSVDFGGLICPLSACSGTFVNLLFTTAPVSEPATLALFGIAFAGLGLSRRRKLH
jgi:hypothetical protein